jgi:hypothetical protein
MELKLQPRHSMRPANGAEKKQPRIFEKLTDPMNSRVARRRVRKTGSSSSGAGRSSTVVVLDATLSSTVACMAAKAGHLPLVRPEKTAAARILLADTQYPSHGLMSRIAALLVLHLGL